MRRLREDRARGSGGSCCAPACPAAGSRRFEAAWKQKISTAQLRRHIQSFQRGSAAWKDGERGGRTAVSTQRWARRRRTQVLHGLGPFEHCVWYFCVQEKVVSSCARVRARADGVEKAHLAVDAVGEDTSALGSPPPRTVLRLRAGRQDAPGSTGTRDRHPPHTLRPLALSRARRLRGFSVLGPPPRGRPPPRLATGLGRLVVVVVAAAVQKLDNGCARRSRAVRGRGARREMGGEDGDRADGGEGRSGEHHLGATTARFERGRGALMKESAAVEEQDQEAKSESQKCSEDGQGERGGPTRADGPYDHMLSVCGAATAPSKMNEPKWR